MAEEERTKRLEFFRRLSVSQREGRLRSCYDDERSDCDELLEFLLEVTDAQKDKQRLIDANERLRARKPKTSYSPAPSSGGSVKCCDGSASPTCVCGGSLRLLFASRRRVRVHLGRI